MSIRDAPTEPLGYVDPQYNVIPGMTVPAWTSWQTDPSEYNEKLQFPQSVETYDHMRADPQVAALMKGMVQPIMRFKWMIDPDGAPKYVYGPLAEDLGLPVLGDTKNKKPRMRPFSHSEVLLHALLALVYGFMYFEIVGEVSNSGRNGGQMWRLKKLEPRMPHSIEDVAVEEDGGLAWIRQKHMDLGKTIPIESLVAFVYDKEGANWYGRSLLRACYQPWLLKDKLLRVDAIRHERNGMGVPIVELPERATPAQKQEAQNLANQYKAGMASGGVLPHGMVLQLLGVSGQTSDVLASIRYHDEQMARLMLQMFTQLGASQVGSRALGESFIKFFGQAQDAVADWYRDTMQRYLVEDWVKWNFGEDQSPPSLIYKRDEKAELSAHELSQMAAQGLLTIDTELENFLRDRYGLPQLSGDRPQPQDFGLPAPTDPNNPQGLPPGPGDPNTNNANPDPTRTKPAPVNQNASLMDLSTRFRRQLYDHEVAAAADFQSLQEEWNVALRQVLDIWKGVFNEQVSQLLDEVKAASTVQQLSDISLTPAGVAELAAHLNRMASAGAEAAIREILDQGGTVARPSLPELTPVAEATSRVIANALSASAARIAVRAGVNMAGEAVENWARSLGTTYLEETLGGALTQAQNAGRFAVFASASVSKLFASEIMDANTCGECANIDGREYTTVEAALEDYPAGGYIFCEGGPRCRGTIVALYGGTSDAG